MIRILIVIMLVFILPANGQDIHVPLLKRDLKIEKIKKGYKDVYFIYASCNDTLYKIVSYNDRKYKQGKKMKEGETHSLWIQSMLNISWNGVKDIPQINLCANYANHGIRIEPDKGIWDVFTSRQLNGKRIIHNSNDNYEEMGICPYLRLDPYHVKKLRDESHGRFGNMESDTNITVIGLTKYDSEMYPPIKKDLTIKKIKRKFKDMYIITAVCNETTYFILSRLIDYYKYEEKLKVGNTYSLEIQPICPRKINGKEQLPPLDHGFYFANHYISLKGGENIHDYYTCEGLNGKRIFDESRVTVFHYGINN